MSEYDKKLIRQSNAGYDRTAADDYVKYRISQIRKETNLYDKLTIRTDDINIKAWYVIEKYDNFAVLKESKHGYKEAFLWFDLLIYQKQERGNSLNKSK